MRKQFLILILLFQSLILPSVEGRDTTVSGINLQYYHPAMDTFGYFGVEGPRLLAPGRFSFRIDQNLALNHIFLIAVNGTPVDLVDHIATTHLSTAVGISPFLTVGLEVPFHAYLREADFTTLAAFNTWSLGDLRMGLKFRLVEEGERRPGLALRITTTLPTGDEMKFAGTSHMVPGVNLIAGKTFRHWSGAINVGAEFPQQKNILGQNFDDRITYGAAVRIPFAFLDPNLSIIGEVRGHLEPNRLQIATAPVEFTAGLEKKFQNGITVAAGGGGAWNNAIGNPRFRGILSLSYTPAKNPPSEASPSADVKTTVYFPANSKEPTNECLTWIHEAAETLKRNSGTILIEGHTDPRGSHASNLKLSLERAERVRRLLLDAGIDPSRIIVKGYNSDRPVASGKTRETNVLNRRAEILWIH